MSSTGGETDVEGLTDWIEERTGSEGNVEVAPETAVDVIERLDGEERVELIDSLSPETREDIDLTDELSTTEKVELIKSAIRDEVEPGSETHLRSKKIAEKTCISSKSVGAFLRKTEVWGDEFTIDKWARARSTTWQVTRQETEASETRGDRSRPV